MDVNEEEISKDEIDREVPNYMSKNNSYFSAHQIQEKWESKFSFVIYSTKKEVGFARCVLSTVRGLNSGRQSLLNYMSTQPELF